MNELTATVLEMIDPAEEKSSWLNWLGLAGRPLAAMLQKAEIYHKKRGEPNYIKLPRAIYFYYLKLNDDRTLKAVEYRYYNKVNPDAPDPPDDDDDDDDNYRPIAYEVVEAKISDLVRNARQGANNPRPRLIRDLQLLSWRRLCYVVVYFDEENWEFFKRATDDNPPIVFLNKKTYKGKTSLANHTFYDGKISEIENRKCFYCINHMKSDRSGTVPIGYDDREQYFNFNLLMDVRLEASNEPGLLVIFDPGGTNQGPPLTP